MRFNSIVVRLKDMTKERIQGHARMFQFHSGSIKSKRTYTHALGKLRFNSIVVRLKEQQHLARPRPRPSFNSIVVRLKGTINENLRAVTRRRFNSIVVRLKGERVPIRPRPRPVSIP